MQQSQQLRQARQSTAEQGQVRSQRPVRQTPTQADAQRKAQQRTGRQAVQIQEAQNARHTSQEHVVAHEREVADEQIVRSVHGGRHMPAMRQERPAADHVQGRHAQDDAWRIDQGDTSPHEDQADSAASQPTEQEAQPWTQQQGRRSEYRPSFGDPTAMSRYARDNYGSGGKAQPYTVNSVGQSGKSKFDRRPNIERATSSGSRSGKKLPNVSPKIIIALVVVFVIVVVVGVLNPFAQTGDTDTGQTGGMVTTAATQPSLPTPIMSESSGITMHSAVAMEDLTEILIHNASYAYANEITTQLTEATNTEIIAAHGTGRVASEQPTGDNWMTGEFIRCFREGNAGPVMSAIDCGGPVGATVYAPVTGKVVLVKQYKLYDEIDDYRIHIQPEGRPDLDVVLIHLTDVTVKPGDHVIAGVTPMAKIRDIFQYLDESLQLKNYTAVNDNGNHTHIQVNNANHPEYHGLDDLKPQAAAPSDGVTPTTDA